MGALGGDMIRCIEQRNIKCLKCETVGYLIVRIGVFYMCPSCFSANFGDDVESIDPTSELGDIYYKWLKVYKEVF